jgi:CubicO group peptidase (beta-lactamase class C family)
VSSNCNALLTAMQSHHAGGDVGISVALFYPGNPDVLPFFGFGSAGPKSTLTADTIYAIGSVTKVFTASLAAYLNVQKVIGDLREAQIGSYLSNPACNPSGVSGSYWTRSTGLTFARLATQTSGMPDEANGAYSEQLFTDVPPSCAQLAWWNDNASSFAQHEGSWIYSSAGFVTLGFAVAAAAAAGDLASGYTNLLAEAITTPLGMSATFAADNVPAKAVLAQGYTQKTNAVPITHAADLKSSATDMLTWLAAVYQAMQLEATGATLTPLQQALAATARIWIADPHKPSKEPTAFAMGLGWQIPTLSSAQALTKDGSTSKGGCSCWVGLTRYDSAIAPAGIALMTNQVGVSPDATARTILEQIIALG